MKGIDRAEGYSTAIYQGSKIALIIFVVGLVITMTIITLAEQAHDGKYKTYPVVRSVCQDTTREGGDRTYRDYVGVGKDVAGSPSLRFQSCDITIVDTDGKEVVIPDYVTNGIVLKGDKLQLMPHVVRKHAKSN